MKFKKLISRGKLKAATLAIAFAPNFASAWKVKATSEQDLFLYEDSLDSYKKYLNLCPDDVNALMVFGAFLNGMGNHEDAIQLFDRAIAINPNHQQAWLNKGYAHSRLARYEDAIAAYDKVLEIDSKHYQALLNKGHSWNFLGEPEKAIACYSDAIAANPDDCQSATNNLSNCQRHIRLLCQKEEFLASEEHQSGIIATNPNNGTDNYHLPFFSDLRISNTGTLILPSSNIRVDDEIG